MEPLRQLAEDKLKDRKVIAVMSAKGGVGKSVISSLLALSIGKGTLLIDMDVHTMATAKLFGFNSLHNVGKGGLEPFSVDGIGLISLSGVVKDNYVLLPGNNVGKVMESLVAYVNMEGFKTVVFDLPPGLGEELLTLERLTGNRFTSLIVTTPSKVSIKVVEYLVKYLKERRVNGFLVVNMSYFNCGKIVRPFGGIDEAGSLSERYSIPLFEMPIDPSIEEFVGKVQDYRGDLKKSLEKIATSL
jgi:Mrp family chromosome partitioning ATPase